MTTIGSLPTLLVLFAALLCLVSIGALIAAGFHATAYRKKLDEFERHMRTAGGERNAKRHL